MGKSKKTRWRAFDGLQEEKQTNGADVKVNGTDSDPHATATSQKYSQILSDHHTNSSTQSNKNSSHHSYKSRAYNNKENFYNQRAGGRPGAQRSWQRGGNYRTSIGNGRDKPEEGEKTGSNDIKDSPPIKFNEDEYTRITTPRQDVLFKKGYLSRMNNKTATNLSATVNSAESTAASSTITTSDPDSSVSTLSPATTPSMDYGQLDGMDYGPMYYPGYYDENGVLVIPMYNGYNYYPPNGSTSTSPVYLMPYPYQYDPFFMTPGGVEPVDGDENSEDKVEPEGTKENNQQAEIHNGARTSSSEDGAGSNNGDENKGESKELNEHDDPNGADPKQCFPNYPNELSGFMYPPYANGYYNNNSNFYYYNGAPTSRHPKMKRRKRFASSRNSQQPHSAETTTDYSDDDTATFTRRFSPRYQNGWVHHNGFNNFNGGRFQKAFVDQNGNQEVNGFHLNVDVQEFFPRVQSSTSQELPSKVNCDEPSTVIEPVDQSTTSKASKVTKPSHSSKPPVTRASKKEIIEGIKSMEQQNIDLTKHHPKANASNNDDWNVIKNGRKVKVVKDIKVDLTSSDVKEVKPDKAEENKIEDTKTEIVALPDQPKKTQPTLNKAKKSKNKSKKKKSHFMAKQDGFEIIEPEFNNTPSNDAEDDAQDLSEDETCIESEQTLSHSEVDEILVLTHVESEAAAPAEEPTPEITQEESPEADDLPPAEIVEDTVIDISDADICSNAAIMPISNDEYEVVAPVESESSTETLVEEKSKAINLAPNEAEIDEQKTTKQKTKKNQAKTDRVATEDEPKCDPFQDMEFFNDRSNIADLERDLMENLKLLDEDIELKSPIINPLYDFPITSAVHKWLQAKQNESFDSLFHVQNFQKLSELYRENDDDETESDISERELKCETDSDYASDFKANGNSPTCSTHAKASSEKSSKCNKLIAKESFCALM